jgi:hypothetical protein
MNPARFVHSASAMTRRLKRRDRGPARLAPGSLEVTHRIISLRNLVATRAWRTLVKPAPIKLDL